MDKPYSSASERNRDPILDVLRLHLGGCRRLLEVGSGTGQHAVHCAAALPHLLWQTSDVPANLPGIRLWLDEAALANTPAALALDVNDWPALGRFDAVYSANTLHIMSWLEVERFFGGLHNVLEPAGQLLIYGPFNRDGNFSSVSNAEFDRTLRSADARRGIRDFEAVDALARAAGMRLLEDHAMPAHNRCLVWRHAGKDALRA